MFTYRTESAYESKFGRELESSTGSELQKQPPWKVRSYLEHQGQKILSRFDPMTYIRLTEQMDTREFYRIVQEAVSRTLLHSLTIIPVPFPVSILVAPIP